MRTTRGEWGEKGQVTGDFARQTVRREVCVVASPRRAASIGVGWLGECGLRNGGAGGRVPLWRSRIEA